MTPRNNMLLSDKDAAGESFVSTSLLGLSMVSFDPIPLNTANALLVEWGHKMGPCKRGNAVGWSHALIHEGRPVAVTVTASLIRERVGGAAHLTRENCIELARLCAARPGLCRVALRLWREFVFPALPYEWAMSYQDADIHNGNTYRFDGWKRIARARSGTDTRSGRPGRDKWVWVYPNSPNVASDLSRPISTTENHQRPDGRD